jgi:hypothetical protein
MAQATSGNHFVNTAIRKRFANDFRPGYKTVGKLFIDGIVLFHVLHNDFAFGGQWWVRLLDGAYKAFQEGFVDNRSSHKPTILGTLALGIGGGNHIEAGSRTNDFASLFDQNGLTFQHALETHDFVAGTVDFVDEKDCTTFHGLDHGTLGKYSLAVEETEATDKIVFVGFW